MAENIKYHFKISIMTQFKVNMAVFMYKDQDFKRYLQKIMYLHNINLTGRTQIVIMY